jgi:hypothetical protein
MILLTDSDSYPDDNPKTVHGEAKPGIHCIPPVAILIEGQAMAEGMRKYGHTNWRHKRVSASVYYNAAQRHLMAWLDGQTCDPDTGIHHLGHARACLAILLDAEQHGMLNDDRTSAPGPAPAFIAEHTTVRPLLPVETVVTSETAPTKEAELRNSLGQRIRVRPCSACDTWDTCRERSWCVVLAQEVLDIPQ